MPTTQWEPLVGLGFDGSHRERWLWRCTQMILGLTTDQAVQVRWGAAGLPDETPALTVKKDLAWTATPGRLLADLERLHKADADPNAQVGSETLEVDVFAWVGWSLSRAEEYGGDLDQHARFPRSRAIASLAGLDHRPIVDEMLTVVRQALVRHCEDQGFAIRQTSPWPDGKRMALWLSHDVDNAEPKSRIHAVRKLGAAVLARNRARRSRRLCDAAALWKGGKDNPYWQMDQLLEISGEFSYSTTYFILPHTDPKVMEGGHSVRRYDIRHAEVKNLMGRLASAGAELGVHITYSAHDRSDGIEQDLRIFEENSPSPPWPPGARSHYLRFFAPQTWRREQEAGLAYDASLGWSSGWGFRSGSTTPFQPFDLECDRPFLLWELELQLMDVAVPVADFLAAASTLVDLVAQTGGCAGILLHPTPWDDQTVSQHRELYRSLLRLLSGRDDIWVSTPSAIVAALTHYATVVTS